MRILKIVAAIALFAVLAMAQGIKTTGPADLLSTVQAHKSITMFDMALTSSGLIRTLREKGPFTVIAPADRAFAALPKGDMQKLMSHPAAMNVLLAHYIVHGNIASKDAASLSSARTLLGVRLRAEGHSGDLRINGAKIVEGDIQCVNGVIHVVDGFDPGLVREALMMGMARPRNP